MTTNTTRQTPQNPTPASDLGQMGKEPTTAKANEIFKGWIAKQPEGFMDTHAGPLFCAIDLAHLVAGLTSADRGLREKAKAEVRALVKAAKCNV